MKMFRLIILILGIVSVNVFASDAHANNRPRMCLSAYLTKPIHVENVTFYVANQPIGDIGIYGTWSDVVRIEVTYFKDQKDFEEKKELLSVENPVYGGRLDVIRFTYESC